jgi:DNA polymerase III epsilon subunit-like protein
LLILDCETSGLCENLSTRFEKQPEIVEFCAIDIDPMTGGIKREMDILIKPIYPIPDEITKMNNITNDMVATAQSFAQASASIRYLIESSDSVVAHNAAFDRDMIDLEIKKLGMTKIAWPRVICTVEATLHLTGFRLSLSALHEYLFNESFSGAHRARADVEALARCVVELRKRDEI